MLLPGAVRVNPGMVVVVGGGLWVVGGEWDLGDMGGESKGLWLKDDTGVGELGMCVSSGETCRRPSESNVRIISPGWRVVSGTYSAFWWQLSNSACSRESSELESVEWMES